jgi:hypothetical protein
MTMVSVHEEKKEISSFLHSAYPLANKKTSARLKAEARIKIII